MSRIKLNDDADLVNEIKQRLKENDGYCPCRVKKIPEHKPERIHYKPGCLLPCPVPVLYRELPQCP